jgi:DNA-binding NarL/FixJ family response regulator
MEADGGRRVPQFADAVRLTMPMNDHARTGADPRTAPIRVFVVDDREQDRTARLIRLGLMPGIRLVGRAGDSAGVLVAIESEQCDVVLITIGPGPRPAGLEVLRRLAAWRERPPAVIVSDSDDPERVDKALALGAVGYLLGSSPLEEVVVALTWAAAGGAYLQPIVAKGMLERRFRPERQQEAGAGLSRRQLELLRALAMGLTNKEIAQELELAPGTVNDYMKQLFQRLGVVSRAAAVGAGIRRGFIV